jgi:hypothetical protein
MKAIKLKLEKKAMFFLLSFMFFFNKIGEQEGKTDSAQKRVRRLLK